MTIILTITAYHTHPHIPKTERIDTRGERNDGRGRNIERKGRESEKMESKVESSQA